MIVHRRLPFQRRVMLVTAVTAFPALLATGVLLWDLDANPILRGTLFALVGLWAIFGVLAVRALIVHPLRSLTSVLEALREGDYQLRARYVDHDDALGEVMTEVNALSRKLYEQRLGSLEADVLLDKLLAEVDIAIFAFDAGQRLRRVNRAGEALLGAQAAQVIGHTADQLGLAAMLGESSGRTMSHEFPGGAGRWEIRRRRFREGGRPHELLVISDLSHALREEERQAWRRLVRVIGHELNNSLAPVRSTAATLRKLIHREPLPPDWREDTLAGLGIVHDRAESLSRFMGAYARLARLPPPVPADVSFAALAAHVASLFAGRVVVEPCADVSLTADRDQLEQVLINLLKNAIEADAAGIVHIRWGALAENVLIDVEDNGPGLARTDSLWVPFFTTKPGGAGIGLALSREIVENHGGTITLENRANARGCVARVTLPMQPNCHGTAKGSEQIGPQNSQAGLLACRSLFARSLFMQPIDRRAFLRALSSAAVTATFAKSIEKAVATPAHYRTGTIDDIEHVVFLMQENRAFDHYFGTMRGVRGYGDPRPAILPSGKPVWYQPDGSNYVLPFHPTADNLGMQFLEDTPHGWGDTQAAWNGGKYDQWIPHKGRSTMAYLTRKDIPFHYALADAFTICDGYHCSLLGPTDPNRYHMWTGWVGNDGQGGGPVISNAEAGYDWSTYPERLERNGISWKIYQDSGVGLDGPGFWGWTDDAYIGNYGDNSLLYFHQYQNAAPGSPLYEKARIGTNLAAPGTPFDALFEPLRQDVRDDKLPKVSWIVAPEAFSEHGNWPANYGAWYVSQVLDALTSNPDVWSKTALFVTYDENDGFFDHLVPPTPPRSAAEGASTVDTTNDIFPGNAGNVRGPYGLGVRVPMIVVSPWTKGGWVCSQTFDHTSLIQFLEKRFARRNRDLIETNITGWRRAVCGDLTSAFDFREPNTRAVKLPETAAYEPQNHDRHPDYVPAVPANQSLPSQEHGVRPSRALPYELRVDGTANRSMSTFRIDFKNTGKAGACFMVRSGNPAEGPWTYTVEADKTLSNTWSLGGSQGKYDLTVLGPNGFFRAYQGTASTAAPSDLDVDLFYDCDDNSVVLRITNQAHTSARIAVASLYGNKKVVETLPRGRALEKRWSLKSSFGWYDLTVSTDSDAGFLRRFAGRLETGRDTFSDPALGGMAQDCRD